MNQERWDMLTINEYLKFDRIPENERLSAWRDVCAFLYLEKKFGPPTGIGDMVSCAMHDKYYLDFTEELVRQLTDADAVYLARCGCIYDTECEDGLAFLT